MNGSALFYESYINNELYDGQKVNEACGFWSKLTDGLDNMSSYQEKKKKNEDNVSNLLFDHSGID